MDHTLALSGISSRKKHTKSEIYDFIKSQNGEKAGMGDGNYNYAVSRHH
jgi:hypothetical protein